MKRITMLKKPILKVLTVLIISLVFTPMFSQKKVSKISDDLKIEVTPATQQKAAATLLKGTVQSDLLQKTDLIIKSADKEMVLIDAISDGNTEALLNELKGLGLTEDKVYGRKVSGYLPNIAIENLEEVKNLVFAAPVYKPVLNSGAAYTNGDIALKSDIVRSSYLLDGTGMKIGVLSDSYNSLLGAEEGVANGELPGEGNPNGYTTEVQVLEDIEDGTDEGRAMCEIIHDIVPAAEIAFSTAYTGTVGFAQGIINLAENGCNIITDDVTYFNEPFFQDGILAQAVDQVVKEKGVAYYSSAGNADRDSYESAFRDGGIHLITNPYNGYVLGSYVMHDFDPGEGVDLFQEVTFTPNSDLLLVFQWDDPFASVCEDCPGARTDLDIFLSLSPDTSDIIIESASYNIESDANEILGVTYSGTDTLTAYVAIGKWIGAPGDNPNPGFIKYINYGIAPVTEYFTGAPTTMGHSNSKSGVGVGAVAWFNTPAFGDDPAIINYFSSVGGIPILFNTRGRRLRRPDYRLSPLFTATDGGNTSFFGYLLNDGDDFPNFFGTSASAPHAAAVAAQLMQMSEGKMRQHELNYILSATALDMDDPFTTNFDYGYDRKTGFGLIQADLAAKEVFKRVGLKTIFPYAECSEDPSVTRRWRISNPNPFAVEVNWEVLNTDQEGSFIAKPGDSYLETETRPYYNILMISYDGPWGGTRKIAAFSPGEVCGGFKNSITDYSGTDQEPTLIIGAYPNPFESTLNLDLYNGREANYIARIFNLQGKEIYSNIIEPASGFFTVQLDLYDLEAGVYILKLATTDGLIVDTYKLMKR